MYNIQNLVDRGYTIKDPWDAVTLFENRLAEYSGSKYAVCVDSCSSGLFLVMKYLKITGQTITLPARTYASVPMQVIHAGNKIRFLDIPWTGKYHLGDTPIVDGAVCFRKGMYTQDTYQCVSFHHRKTLKIGKGGVILTNDINFVNWCRPMIYDGRHKYTLHSEDIYECIGYHMYMTPEEAATGLILMESVADDNPDTGSSTTYKDLRLQKVFEEHYG